MYNIELSDIMQSGGDSKIYPVSKFEEDIKHLVVSKSYVWALNKFVDFLERKGKNLDNFNSNDVQAFLMTFESYQSTKVAKNAIRKYLTLKMQNLPQDDNFEKEYFRLLLTRESLRSIRIRKEDLPIEKRALTIDELKMFLDLCKKIDKKKYVAAVIVFYFGARPLELTKHFANGEINFEERYIIIKNAKKSGKRYLVWHPYMDPYVLFWRRFCENYLSGLRYAYEWITKQFKPICRLLGMHVTAKTGRITFETYMRKFGIEQWKIDYLLGHSTKVPDIYTDATQILDELREVMGPKHYMILNREYLGI